MRARPQYLLIAGAPAAVAITVQIAKAERPVAAARAQALDPASPVVSGSTIDRPTFPVVFELGLIPDLDGTALDADVSFARVPDGGGEWRVCTSPSPGETNRCPDAPTASASASPTTSATTAPPPGATTAAPPGPTASATASATSRPVSGDRLHLPEARAQ